MSYDTQAAPSRLLLSPPNSELLAKHVQSSVSISPNSKEDHIQIY